MVGPTAGRFLIDIVAGKPAKQFVAQRVVCRCGCAYFARVLYLFAISWPGLVASETLIALTIGFITRMLTLWYAWEEPMPWNVSDNVMGEIPRRETLKEKMAPDWEEPGI